MKAKKVARARARKITTKAVNEKEHKYVYLRKNEFPPGTREGKGKKIAGEVSSEWSGMSRETTCDKWV